MFKMDDKVYQLRVTNGKGKRTTFRYRKALKRRGFVYRGGASWTFNGTKRTIRKKKRFAKRKKLTITVVEEKYTRNSDYRNVWFECNRPFLGFYLCTYCGRLVREENITVDHVIPVAILKFDTAYAKKYRKKLDKMGCESVNDIKKLCGSCYYCNEKKRNQTWSWVKKGLRYRHRSMRILRFILTIILVGLGIFAIYMLIKLGLFKEEYYRSIVNGRF